MTLRTGVWRLLLGIESGDLPLIYARVYGLITLLFLVTDTWSDNRPSCVATPTLRDSFRSNL